MNAEHDSLVIIDCKDESWDGVLYEKLWEMGPIRLITLHSSYEGLGRGAMCVLLRRVAGQKPQRGDLFVATRPLWDGPNPSGVTCGGSTLVAASGEMPVTKQVTPLGFDRTSEGGVTINRPPRWGLSVARLCAGQPKLPRQPTPGVRLAAHRASLARRGCAFRWA